MIMRRVEWGDVLDTKVSGTVSSILLPWMYPCMHSRQLAADANDGIEQDLVIPTG